MTDIRLHNSATRQKEVFTPHDDKNVRMYVCGPTVYDRAHIGNARPAVVFDVLYRLLRHKYGEDHVRYVRNITDIDDKINNRAKESLQPGETPEAAIRRITDQTAGWYQEDMAALSCLSPTEQPRATEFVPEMVAMIAGLIDKGNAYAAEGHVLFEVGTYPEYGRLSGRSTDDMIAGARVEVAPYKRDPMDFVLWKPSEPDQPGWDSPWGRGRPGWHIECSAMASKLLGESFDIHGGGADLMFPHHENEIAQSCCAAPGSGFARFWVHNGMIRVDGQKMSKSLGNFFTVHDKLEEGMSEEVIRYLLLSTHYRQPLDWTEERVDEAKTLLANWGRLKRKLTEAGMLEEWDLTPVDEGLIEALADDLNTSEAFKRIGELANAVRLAKNTGEAGRAFVRALDWLGLSVENLNAREIQKSIATGFDQAEIIALVDQLLQDRAVARIAKDFAAADAIRKGLDEAGIMVIDNQGGPSDWSFGPQFDAAKLKALR